MPSWHANWLNWKLNTIRNSKPYLKPSVSSWPRHLLHPSRKSDFTFGRAQCRTEPGASDNERHGRGVVFLLLSTFFPLLPFQLLSLSACQLFSVSEFGRSSVAFRQYESLDAPASNPHNVTQIAGAIGMNVRSSEPLSATTARKMADTHHDFEMVRAQILSMAQFAPPGIATSARAETPRIPLRRGIATCV